MSRDKIADRSQLHHKVSDEVSSSTVSYNADKNKITNIIKAYATLDPDVGYSPGYNYTVALLLRFIEDEELAFWCFVGLMKLLDWRKFFILDNPFFGILPGVVEKMLKGSAPHIHKAVYDDSPCCVVGLCNLVAGEFLMAIGAKLLPIEESKLIFDFLLL